MHLVQTKSGQAAQKTAADGPPFGPGFDQEIVRKTAKLEIWGSDFNEPGSDYCVFRAFDDTGNRIAEQRTEGY